MNKKDNTSELVNFLTISLTHKIGNIVNSTKPYAEKYRKESENFLDQAMEISKGEHWNNYDKIEIKNALKRKLINSLLRKEYLNDKKFDLVDEEIREALASLELLPE